MPGKEHSGSFKTSKSFPEYQLQMEHFEVKDVSRPSI